MVRTATSSGMRILAARARGRTPPSISMRVFKRDVNNAVDHLLRMFRAYTDCKVAKTVKEFTKENLMPAMTIMMREHQQEVLARVTTVKGDSKVVKKKKKVKKVMTKRKRKIPKVDLIQGLPESVPTDGPLPIIPTRPPPPPLEDDFNFVVPIPPLSKLVRTDSALLPPRPPSSDEYEEGYDDHFE